MNTINVVVYWRNGGELVITPTPLSCDNLIPLQRFVSGDYDVQLYTNNEEQVFHLQEFPAKEITTFVIHTAQWRMTNFRMKKSKR